MQALTAAALALPGLAHTPVCAAQDDTLTFQYGHYEEGGGPLSQFRDTGHSVHVDSLQAGGNTSLSDRLKLFFHYIQDTWSGATPISTAPASSVLRQDTVVGASPFWNVPTIAPYDPTKGLGIFSNPNTGETIKTDETVQVMAFASPEVRKQEDFKLGYEWNEAELDVGGGVSVERDYDSSFVNMAGRWDLNQKLTTLALGLSYTNSFVHANRFPFNVVNSDVPNPPTVQGHREDGAVSFGLTQVLSKNSLLQAGVSFTQSTGYLSNPYKEVLFFAPLNAPELLSPDPSTGLLQSLAFSKFDNRPRLRDQWTWDARYAHYFTDFDAALHLDYKLYHDSWGITAHTFEANWAQPLGHGWTITPIVRYYSQSAANFYSPFFVLNQTLTFDDYLNVATNGDTSKLNFPAHFSSDYRLSAFGALSGGLTLSKQFSKGVSLEAGFQYYTHQSGLKLGGGGTGHFEDFNYYLVNGAIRVDLDAVSAGGSGHDAHAGHSQYWISHEPAGVMFAHMLDKAGQFMVGYRYMYNHQAGDTLLGSHAVGDAEIVANACGSLGCGTNSKAMSMHMHMLNLMYAPTDWLNLMLMPQFVDMNMTMRPLAGGVINPGGGHMDMTAGGTENKPMNTGGVGDTGMFALVKLLDATGQHMHASIGVSAPTGPVDLKMSGGNFFPFGMQLGSGTWDFWPSLTYTGHRERWSWGSQLSVVKRLEDHNKAGFAFGDKFQSTAWGSYSLFDWLSASVRGVYTVEGKIRGQFNGPHDISQPTSFPANYGGQFWDVGFGLNAAVKSGELRGNHFSVEWLQPVATTFNGYQLDRQGALFATWGLSF